MMKINNLSFKYLWKIGYIQRMYPSGSETGVSWENQANTVDIDVLGPCIARSSSAMRLAVGIVVILVPFMTGIQQPAYIFLCFQRNFQRNKG